VRPWYVVGGAVSVIMGLGAFFVPVIVNIEQNNGHSVDLTGLRPETCQVFVEERET
jgi:hypothetical protein